MSWFALLPLFVPDATLRIHSHFVRVDAVNDRLRAFFALSVVHATSGVNALGINCDLVVVGVSEV